MGGIKLRTLSEFRVSKVYLLVLILTNTYAFMIIIYIIYTILCLKACRAFKKINLIICVQVNRLSFPHFETFEKYTEYKR